MRAELVQLSWKISQMSLSSCADADYNVQKRLIGETMSAWSLGGLYE